jgi:hypothetical protein
LNIWSWLRNTPAPLPMLEDTSSNYSNTGRSFFMWHIAFSSWFEILKGKPIKKSVCNLYEENMSTTKREYSGRWKINSKYFVHAEKFLMRKWWQSVLCIREIYSNW